MSSAGGGAGSGAGSGAGGGSGDEHAAYTKVMGGSLSFKGGLNLGQTSTQFFHLGLVQHHVFFQVLECRLSFCKFLLLPLP